MRIRKLFVALVCVVLPLQAVAVTGLAPRLAADVATAMHDRGDHGAHQQHTDRTPDEAPGDCDACGDCTPCLSPGGLVAPTDAGHPVAPDGAAHSLGTHAGARSFTPEVPKRPPLARFL
ncbi:MAG: hypothetical protein KJ025_18165 [Burkholderiales bacterium]|nr:hypothetical protein [Burkholderiales bacterium]